MSDLISRQEAIDALVNLTCYGIEEIENLCNASVADSEGWIGGIKDAIDEIKLIPSAEPEQKWIPVSEALPDEYIDVLLQFPHTMAVGYQEDGFWNIITCDDLYSGLDEEDEKPIAWMPLPEPYRGEEWSG